MNIKNISIFFLFSVLSINAYALAPLIKTVSNYKFNEVALCSKLQSTDGRTTCEKYIPSGRSEWVGKRYSKVRLASVLAANSQPVLIGTITDTGNVRTKNGKKYWEIKVEAEYQDTKYYGIEKAYNIRFSVDLQDRPNNQFGTQISLSYAQSVTRDHAIVEFH